MPARRTPINPTRSDELIEIWKDYRTFYQLVGGGIFVLIGILIGGAFFSGDEGYLTNLYTEFISIAVTVSIIDILNRRREMKRHMSELCDRLKREMSSQDNTTAINAIREITAHGWLHDGTLRNVNLTNANLAKAQMFQAQLNGASLAGATLVSASLEESSLRGAALISANLNEADLREADLSETVLQFANLSRANLDFAILHNAVLTGANLAEATLREAELQNANLVEARMNNVIMSRADLTSANLGAANLRGVNMSQANLTNVQFKTPFGTAAILDEHTILPDGSRFDPSASLAQLERFTDENHPDFWKPKQIQRENPARTGVKPVNPEQTGNK